MKKVKFIKDHVNGIKKGVVADFSSGRADYLVRVGVAEYVTSEPIKDNDAKPKIEEPKEEIKHAVVKPKAGLKKAVKKDTPCKDC